MLALSAILVLLGALLVFTTLLNIVGLSDKTQALGLPEGSVRAIMALSLVGLFAVLAASSLQSMELLTFNNRSEEAAEALRRDNPNARDFKKVASSEAPSPVKPTTFTVTFYSPVHIDDFAKQMLTLVGTLMTAVISFYFGNATKAGGNVSRAPPELSGIVPVTLAPTSNQFDLKITGNNLNSIRTVKLTGTGDKNKGTEIEAQSIMSNQSQVTCTIPGHEALNREGTWDVTVADDIGRPATKKNGLTVKAAAEAPSPIKPG